MLLKLVLLLGAICAVSPEIVEIDCIDFGVYCLVEDLPMELDANDTWKFLCPQSCPRFRANNVTFPRIPRELFLTHPQLEELYLIGTDIEELAFGDFFNAAKLYDFTITNNTKPMSVHDNCFWGAFGLTTLGLYTNKINVVEVDAFNGLPQLTWLQLDDNQISYISNDHFRNLPNLFYLYLHYNNIATIESEAFLHNPKMAFLNIESNNLTEVDLLLPHIKTGRISLFDNHLTKVFIRSISQEIDEMEVGIDFKLDYNELKELYIQPNFAAEKLILANNPYDQIGSLPALKPVKLLNLKWCKLKSLDEQRFADKYENLVALHLTGNNMTTFSKEAFAGLDKLDTLELDVNELTELDFPRMESLTYLNLRNNSFTEFPYREEIRDLFPSLLVLDIANNKFNETYLAELVETLTDQFIQVRWQPVPWRGY